MGRKLGHAVGIGFSPIGGLIRVSLSGAPEVAGRRWDSASPLAPLRELALCVSFLDTVTCPCACHLAQAASKPSESADVAVSPNSPGRVGYVTLSTPFIPANASPVAARRRCSGTRRCRVR